MRTIVGMRARPLCAAKAAFARAAKEHSRAPTAVATADWRTFLFTLALDDAEQLFEGALEGHDVLQPCVAFAKPREQQQHFVAHNLALVLGQGEHAADSGGLIEDVCLGLPPRAREQLHHQLHRVEAYVEVAVL